MPLGLYFEHHLLEYLLGPHDSTSFLDDDQGSFNLKKGSLLMAVFSGLGTHTSAHGSRPIVPENSADLDALGPKLAGGGVQEQISLGRTSGIPKTDTTISDYMNYIYVSMYACHMHVCMYACM